MDMHTRIDTTDTHKQAACNSCPWTGDVHSRTSIDADYNARWQADTHDMEHRR